MTMTDPISDLLTRIRNGQMVRKPKISCPASKIKVAILKVLQEEGYIRGFEITEDEKGKQLEISLKYFDGKPVIKEISRVSSPFFTPLSILFRRLVLQFLSSMFKYSIFCQRNSIKG